MLKPYPTWKHGHTIGVWSKTYRSWAAMRQRCLDQNQENYERYGGRGITIDPRWNDFRNFLADMGECPEGYSLDRYPDRTGNYEPGNCRWATCAQQNNNQTSNINVEFLGKTQNLSAWARELNMGFQMLRRRYHSGWSIERLLTTPSRKNAKR